MKQRKQSNPRPRAGLHVLTAFRAPFFRGESASRGYLVAGAVTIRCALGRSGARIGKREGDGASPIGRFRILEVLYRPDRWRRRRLNFPIRPLHSDDLWCDEPCSRLYNRKAKRPLKEGHEQLWRHDHLYDVILVLNHNQRPRIRSAGSAIFFHIASEDYGPTEGCVAISAPDMRRLLPRLAKGASLAIR